MLRALILILSKPKSVNVYMCQSSHLCGLRASACVHLYAYVRTYVSMRVHMNCQFIRIFACVCELIHMLFSIHAHECLKSCITM